MDTIKIIDNLNIDEAKYLEFDVSAGLKVNSGDWKYNIMAVDENGFKIKMPYEFSVNTNAVDLPNIILADYAIENNFGTNYIPKSEVVELTVRIQNVGQGLTEKIEFNLLENHTYSAIDFTGYLELNEMKPGDFTDINFKIKKGECIGIVGESGSGKSTLMNMLIISWVAVLLVVPQLQLW